LRAFIEETKMELMARLYLPIIDGLMDIFRGWNFTSL